ncbi:MULTISPECIES: helicase associated domain-containing protein [unclassified Streptomyces]|uniref:helicase associated domain-containing protein n=1 Tax=unclassified Streptomyces TaxID=2593676 RepID=UPI002D21B475|nr:helicase associated domain-containing protein [Streptomyces sp. H-KF8]
MRSNGRPSPSRATPGLQRRRRRWRLVGRRRRHRTDGNRGRVGRTPRPRGSSTSARGTSGAEEAVERIVGGGDGGGGSGKNQEVRELKLGAWIGDQRSRAATLTPERMEQLSAIGMRWS